MLTKEQIRWAASHDWFVADCLNGTIQVRDVVVWADGHITEDYITWTKSFRELREWAGY